MTLPTHWSAPPISSKRRSGQMTMEALRWRLFVKRPSACAEWPRVFPRIPPRQRNEEGGDEPPICYATTSLR